MTSDQLNTFAYLFAEASDVFERIADAFLAYASADAEPEAKTDPRPATAQDQDSPPKTQTEPSPAIAQGSPAPAPDAMPLDKFRDLVRKLVERDRAKAPGLIRPVLADVGVEGGIVDVPEHRRMEFLKALSDAIKTKAGS